MAVTLAASPAQAASTDVPCDAGALVRAVNAANASYSEPDTLSLASNCVYTLTEPVADFWGAGLPAIQGKLTINGNHATIRRLPDAPQFRIISNIGDLTLDDLTLTGGRAPDGVGTKPSGAGEFGDNGGAIETWRPLTVNNSIITGNSAGAGAPGADATDTTAAGDGGLGGWGGGIFAYRAATLTIINSSITDNVTGAGGRGGNGFGAKAGGGTGSGGYGGGVSVLDGTTVSIRDTSITDNATADGGQGGTGGANGGRGGEGGSGGAGAGIFISAAEGKPMNSTVTATTITGNRAGRGGDPGVSGPGYPYPGSSGFGGTGGGIKVMDETLTVSSGKISDNTAGEHGPGIGIPALGGGIAHIDGQITLTDAADVTGNHPDNCYPAATVTGCVNSPSTLKADSADDPSVRQLKDLADKEAAARIGT